MTDNLPPNLLALFAPRPPLRFLNQTDYAPEKRCTAQISGVGQYLPQLEAYKKTEYPPPTESGLQRKERIKQEKKDKTAHLLGDGLKDYKPNDDPKARGDAFKTLFIARLAYDVEERDLLKEFGKYGDIIRCRIVKNEHVPKDAPKKKRMRGYAFIVFENEADMKAAYKETDGIRIKDRRCVVDVERGRTVAGWRPRRFGGGLGGRGYTKAAPARPAGGPGFGGPPMGPGGFGGRGGGFRGGFQGRGGGGGGGFRGGFQGGRGGGSAGFGGGRLPGGGIGTFSGNGFQPGAPPNGAPAGPRGGGRENGGGFRGGYGNRDGGGFSNNRDRPSFDDRRGGGQGASSSGSNREPVNPRGRFGDRDGGDPRIKQEAGGYDSPRYVKHESGGYDSPRYVKQEDQGDRKRPHDGDSSYGGDRSRRRY